MVATRITLNIIKDKKGERTLKIDEDIKNLIPPLTAEEYKQLEENILKDGCRDALVTWNAILLDGHNRYKICTENSITYETVDMDFSEKQDAIQWVIMNQLGRRNLNDYQRGELVLKLKPVIREKAKERQHTSTGGKEPQLLGKLPKADQRVNTREELAEKANLSGKTLDKIEKILKDGTPEQNERAEKGGKGNSINAIHNEIKEKEKEKTKHQQRREGKKMIKDMIADIKDHERKIEYTIDGAVEEFEANFYSSFDSWQRTLEKFSDVIMQPQNNSKMIAALSQAEAAIQNLKGKYLYE